MNDQISIPEYPNIEKLVTGMPVGMQQMALMYLGMLPPDMLVKADAALPELERAHENDDDMKIVSLLESLGVDPAMAANLAEMRHGFYQAE